MCQHFAKIFPKSLGWEPEIFSDPHIQVILVAHHSWRTTGDVRGEPILGLKNGTASTWSSQLTRQDCAKMPCGEEQGEQAEWK